MPPKSKKRVKKAPTPDYDSESEPSYEHDQLLVTSLSDALPLSSANPSQKGFLALPKEVTLVMLSCYPTITTEHCLMNGRFINDYTDAPDFFERFNVLRALSQSCRFLRQIYLPLLWERFQVSLSTNVNGAWFREFGKAMERKSKGLLESKHLWPYVRVITVTLTRFQPTNVLPPFVKLLRTLPNVHTLEIPHAHSAMTTALKEAFEGSVFPTIEKIVLPSCAHEVLRCCPSIREVTCVEDDGARLFGALAHGGCSKLESIRNVTPGPVLMKRLSKKNPPLRCIRINTRVEEREKTIEACSAFPSLRVIELDCKAAKGSIEGWVKQASDALRACCEYKPAPNRPKRTRARKASEGEQSLPEPQDLQQDPRVVRVLEFPYRGHFRDQAPAEYVPEVVKEFPV